MEKLYEQRESLQMKRYVGGRRGAGAMRLRREYASADLHPALGRRA